MPNFIFSMLYYDFIDLYIARPTYCFILKYTCGLTVVIKRMCYEVVCLYTKRVSTPVSSTPGVEKR